MTNRELLLKATAGFKKTYLAEQLGISVQGYINKEAGKSDFRQREIAKLQDILRLTDEERDAIFFTHKVEENNT